MTGSRQPLCRQESKQVNIPTHRKAHEMNAISYNTNLNDLVDAQRSVQLGQLTLVSAAQESDQLLQQGLLVIATLGSGGRTQHLIQRTRNTLPAQSKETK